MPALMLLPLLAALAVAPPDPRDPKAMVAALASGDAGERDAATRALESLGRDALPALEAAIRGADETLRERANAVWEAVQRTLVTRPSLIRLERGGTPADVARAIQAQTGMTVEVGQRRPDEPVGGVGPEPVTFWDAIGRMGFSQTYEQSLVPGLFPKLQLNTQPTWQFIATSGPFRVVLTGLHWHRDRTLIGGPWVRVDRFGQRINVGRDEPASEKVRFFGGLDVMVEPRVWFTQEAPARLNDAADDRGQSLLPEQDDQAAATLHDGAHFSFYGGRGTTRVATEFRLRGTDRPGHTAQLRGVVPLMLHIRRPAPALVIPLADAAGKTFQGGDAEFEVVSVDESPTRTTVTTIVRLDVAKADLPDKPDPQLLTTRLQVLGNHQIELVDAEGKILADSAGGGSGGGTTPAVYRWTISTNRKGKATHLRYFRMLRVRADAPFAFHNVPLPRLETGPAEERERGE